MKKSNTFRGGPFAKGNNPNTQLTDIQQKQVDIDREIVRRGGLRAFIKLAWPIIDPAVFVNNWSVDAIALHLEAAYRGDIKQLLMNVPPGCMKSLTTCVFGPVYAWIREPKLSWLFTSFDGELTMRDAKKSLLLMQTPWFRNRWGDIFQVSDGSAIGLYSNSRGGWRLATSVDGKSTGHHPDVVVIDDPLKPKDITEVGLAAVRSWWGSTLSTRASNQGTVRRICIMQRLHQDDLAAVLLEEGGWEHLCIPMEYEARAAKSTSIWTDPRIHDGELMWPERFSAEVVRTLKIRLTSVPAAAQLQQRPSPEGGSTFKEEWFQFYDPSPEAVRALNFEQVIQSWDCTFKGHDRTDFVVGQVWGRKGSDFYLLDEYRKQMDFVETQAAMKMLRARWPRSMAIVIEDKANGPALEVVLKKDLSGIILVDPRGGKESRANSCASYYEAKNVWLPNPEYVREDGFKPFAWVTDHKAEFTTFPTSKYDDRVDCGSQALIYLGERHSNLVAAMASLKGIGNNLFRHGGLLYPR